MGVYQRFEVSYKLNGQTYQTLVRIDRDMNPGGNHAQQSEHFRASIESSPLHGTASGRATTIDEALDYLNLSMQAAGADEIHFSTQPVGH